MYEQRTYRHEIRHSDLISFSIKVKETDLYIRAVRDLTGKAITAVENLRQPLEKYIAEHPLFLHSLEPLPVEEDAPGIVKLMAEAGRCARVGPMAAVAGAIAELIGAELLQFSDDLIVENGGDIFIKTSIKRLIGIYAGKSVFTGKIALEIDPGTAPCGVCTSSGTVGHSLSLGMADAAIVLSKSTALADAAATAVGNMVKSVDDVPAAVEYGKGIVGISGIVVIAGDRMGVWGDAKLVKL